MNGAKRAARNWAWGVYRKIVEPELIENTEVFDEAWYEGQAAVTQTLVEHDDRTTLTLTVRYDSKDVRDHVLQSPMKEGVAACYDRLEEILEERRAATA